jgi:hypothetical protein
MVADDDLEGVTRLLEHFLGLSPEEKQAMGQRARQVFWKNSISAEWRHS